MTAPSPRSGGQVLREVPSPNGWPLTLLIVWAGVAGRREIVQLVLGLVALVRAASGDVPAVVRAIFGTSNRR